jgi:hypothetical protein
MASFLRPLAKLIHGTASTLIDNQVTARLSNTVGDLIASGFKVVEEVLKVAQDLTAPDPAQPSPPSPPEPGEQP